MPLTIDGHDYLDWRTWTPPRWTWVWALYRDEDKPQLVKTCKRGCCVHTVFGCQLLPRLWRAANEEEATAAEADWLKPREPIDPFSLYE